MPNPYLSRLEEVLWPKGFRRDIWMVVDGARDPRVYVTLVKSYLEYSCLYSGAIAPALQRAAPYLVQLELGGSYTRELLECAWGQNWGVILRCDLELEQLRKHLRKFLMVADARGRKLLFRYYDPRVLRAYLPTCNPQELREFCGPIETFYLEAADPRVALQFHRDGTRLAEATHQLAMAAGR
jgi:hypothetical protein